MIGRFKHNRGRMPVEAKSALAFAIASVVIKGIAFITTPVFTRIMSIEQYGILSVYNSWSAIIEVFALLGLTSAGVFNTGLNDYQDRRDKFISSVLILCNIQTILVFTILFTLKFIIGPDFILPYNLLIVMFIHFIFNPAQIFWITRQRYEYKYKLATVITIATSILSQVIAVLCICNISVENSAEVKIWSSTLAGLIVALPIYILLLNKGRCIFDRNIWKEILAFAIPLIPHYLAQHIMSSADRIMISDMVSEKDAAIYSLASTVSLIATVIWGAIHATLTPYIFDKLNKQKHRSIDKTVFSVAQGYAIVCLGVSLVAPEAIKILGTSDYYAGIYAIPPIAATAFLTAFYNIYATIEFYHKKSKFITISTVIATVINVVLNGIFIPQYGFIAAAYTTLISYVFLVLMHYAGYRRCSADRIYNDRNFLLLAMFCVLGCGMCNLLYLNTVVRFIVIGVFVVTSSIVGIRKLKNSQKQKESE